MNLLEALDRGFVCVTDPFCIRKKWVMRKVVREIGNEVRHDPSIHPKDHINRQVQRVRYKFRKEYRRWREVRPITKLIEEVVAEEFP